MLQFSFDKEQTNSIVNLIKAFMFPLMKIKIKYQICYFFRKNISSIQSIFYGFCLNVTDLFQSYKSRQKAA